MKSIWKPFAIYALLDILCTGMGMGVPIMNIQLGFLAGWYLARRLLLEYSVDHGGAVDSRFRGNDESVESIRKSSFPRRRESTVILQLTDLQHDLRTLLIRSLVTVLLTFAMMAVIWGPWCKVLWDPNYDYTQTGVPLILYGAKTSFIGWMVLMIFISPFLQLLTTLSAAAVTLAASGVYNQKERSAQDARDSGYINHPGDPTADCQSIGSTS